MANDVRSGPAMDLARDGLVSRFFQYEEHGYYVLT
jgi:hypothetical protein